MTARHRRRVAAAAAVMGTLMAGAAMAGTIAPYRSFDALTLGNGHGAAVYDLASARLSTLRDHVYAQLRPGEPTVDLAYDSYFGLRVAGQGRWLGEAPVAEAGYVGGTAIARVVQSHGPVTAEQYFFAPLDLEAPAVVMLVRLTASQPVSDAKLFSLHNFHLGDGAGSSAFDGERIDYLPASHTFVERGTSTGRVMVYRSLVAPERHAASPTCNPYPTVASGGLLEDVDSSGVTDDAVCGFQLALPALSQAGAEVWHGVVIAKNPGGEDAEQLAARVEAYVAGRGAEQLLAAEKQAWQGWHQQTVEPAGLSADERAVYRQALAVLRIGQCREPNLQGSPQTTPHGQLVASLPPGKWDIAWVRDGAYAIAALARAGHLTEARAGLEFMLRGRAGNYVCCDGAGQPYVGRPYALSVTRYFGDGSEESDHNQDGPNVEFDNFGLFLWAAGELTSRLDPAEAKAFVTEWQTPLFDGVADVLVALVDENSGLLRADSSIWEHHWENGGKRHHTYSNIFAVAGLRAAAGLVTLAGDPTRAKTYGDTADGLATAVAKRLVDPATGVLASDLESLPLGPTGFVDAAVTEAFNHRVVAPAGTTADATLAAFDQHLRTAHGPGYKRNDDGDAYDEREWVVIDLRVASARFLRGEAAAGQALLDWITGMARANHDLIPELLDQQTAAYAGEVPMIGFGAGAYVLSLFDRAAASTAPPPPPPTDAGDPTPDAGTSDTSPAGDAGPVTSPDAGTPTADATAPGNGRSSEGCAVAASADAAPWWLVLALLPWLCRGAKRLFAILGLLAVVGCTGYDPTPPPAARLSFVLDLPPGATAEVTVYDANDREVGKLEQAPAGKRAEVALEPNADHNGLRVVARAGERVLKTIVARATREDRLDVGRIDARTTAAAQLIQEKIAGQGGSFGSVPVSAIEALLEQIAAEGEAAIPEVARFAALVKALLDRATVDAPTAADARGEPLFSPLSARLSEGFIAARKIDEQLAADYRNLLTGATERLAIELVCDAALVKVMFTVDTSGQGLDGNGAPQLVRQPNKAGRVFLALTVDDSSPVPDAAGLLPAQMIPNDPERAMFDDGTGGDELAGDGVFTRVLVLPRGMRVKYKYTNGSAGEGWTRTEEWPGNARLLLVKDLLTRHSDGSADCLVIRRDAFGDEASNKNQVNLHRKIKGGPLAFDRDLGGEPAVASGAGAPTIEGPAEPDPDARVVGGLALHDLRQRPPLTPAGVAEAAENGTCDRCPPPLTISADDQTPPEAVSAAFTSTTRVEVRFSEAMAFAAASDSSNYLILDGAGRPLPVLAAAASGSQVSLSVVGPDFGQSYRLRLRKLTDASANANPLTEDSELVIGLDRTAPQLVGARPGTLRDLNPSATPDDPTVGEVVVVTFDEELDSKSAENAGNYRLTDAVGRPLAIKAAHLRGDGRRQVYLVTDRQKKGRPYDLASAGVRDLSGNRVREREPLRLFGFALYKMTFGAVPGHAFLDLEGKQRGLPAGAGLYLTGTVLAVARDLEGNSLAVEGRTDVTGHRAFEMKPSSEQYRGKPVYKISLLAPPGVYAWKVAHGVEGEHRDPPATLAKVHKSLCTSNDGAGVNIDPATLAALAVTGGDGEPTGAYLDYGQAKLSADGNDPAGPFTLVQGEQRPRPRMMFRRENPDEVCTVKRADVECPALVVGTWRDIEAFRVGDKTNDYDDGLPEVAPTRLIFDAQPPRLLQLAVRDSESLLLSFDERLAVDAGALTVTARHAKQDTPLPINVELVGAIGEALLPSQLLLRTGPMEAGAPYALELAGLVDAAGNALPLPLSSSWTAPASFTPFSPLADDRPPKVIGVLPKGPTSLLVQLDEKVQAASASDVASYAIEDKGGDALAVNSATLQGGGTAVLLATALQVQQADYALTVRGLTDLASPPNTLVEQKVSFKGFGDSTPPKVIYAQAISPGEVAVAFDEALSPLSAPVATSYQIAGLKVLSVQWGGDASRRSASFDPTGARLSDHVVVLQTSKMAAGQAYEVAAPGVTDLSNNPAGGSLTFTGVAAAPKVDLLISYRVSASETVAGKIPSRAISTATLTAEREGLFIRGATVSTDGATKGAANEPITAQLGGFPPEGQPLTGPDPELRDDGQGGDAKAGDDVYTIRIAGVPLGTSVLFKAFASYTVAYKSQNPGDAKAAFADAAPGPAVFSDGQEFPGNENAVRVLGDADGDGVVRIRCLFGDETTYKKFTDAPPFAWVVDDVQWRAQP